MRTPQRREGTVPQHDQTPRPGTTETADEYMRLLKGEISSQEYVEAVKDSVRERDPNREVRQPRRRLTRRQARAAG